MKMFSKPPLLPLHYPALRNLKSAEKPRNFRATLEYGKVGMQSDLRQSLSTSTVLQRSQGVVLNPWFGDCNAWLSCRACQSRSQTFPQGWLAPALILSVPLETKKWVSCLLTRIGDAPGTNTYSSLPRCKIG